MIYIDLYYSVRDLQKYWTSWAVELYGNLTHDIVLSFLVWISVLIQQTNENV